MQRLNTIEHFVLRLAIVGLMLLGVMTAAPAGEQAQVLQNEPAAEPIVPIPLEIDVDRDKAALGERLFHDPRLSHDDALACVSCHDLERGGDDGLPLSRTNDGRPGMINAPTVFNSVLNFRLGWRGNYRRLDDQIEADLYDPKLMNTSWGELLPKLRAETGYTVDFRRIYEDGVTKENILDALSAFHRSLLTPNARFDQYLRGREDALSDDEKRGYRLFKSLGCVSCHQGANIGGNLFQKVGIFKDYFAGRGNVREIDFGRFLDTGAERDLFVFRVPSLRNVAVTAPYFHDGSVAQLDDAVRKMAEIQLGQALTEEEIGLIMRFLRTLTGEYNGQPIAPD
jgi:cytochrome c peroxidase